MAVTAVERRLFQILYIIQYVHPGEKSLPCALNDYDFYRLYYLLFVGNFQEELEDLNRVEEITGKSKFFLTFCLCLYILVLSQIAVFSLDT